MDMSGPRPAARQRGVALITALLVVALASIAAVAMTQRQQIDIRRTANVLAAGQGLQYGLGGEDWARTILARDFEDDRTNGTVDSLDEIWAQQLPPTMITGGTISGRIEDLQGRFNLNSLTLAVDQEKDRGAPPHPQLVCFQRLLQVLELDPAIAQAAADWVDADARVRFPDGAEDVTYLAQETPYRAANGPMADPSELRMIKGVSAEAYAKLRPFISALPQPTTINVNTAPAPVLQALDVHIDATIAAELVKHRDEKPFKDKQAFLDALTRLLGGEDQTATDGVAELIDVSSSYFLVHADVALDRARVRLASTLERDGEGRIRLLARGRGQHDE